MCLGEDDGPNVSVAFEADERWLWIRSSVRLPGPIQDGEDDPVSWVTEFQP